MWPQTVWPAAVVCVFCWAVAACCAPASAGCGCSPVSVCFLLGCCGCVGLVPVGSSPVHGTRCSTSWAMWSIASCVSGPGSRLGRPLGMPMRVLGWHPSRPARGWAWCCLCRCCCSLICCVGVAAAAGVAAAVAVSSYLGLLSRVSRSFRSVKQCRGPTP